MNKTFRVAILISLTTFFFAAVTVVVAASGSRFEPGDMFIAGSGEEVNVPSIVLTKTVSADPGVCSPNDTATVIPGEKATYCYTVGNNGTVTMTSHTLEDDKLGTLFEDFAEVLPPGATYVFSVTVVITDAVTNNATWTAMDVLSQTVQASDSATVSVFNPQISLSKTVNETPGVCPGPNSIQIIPGEIVNYCFAVTNTGPVTLTTHTLTDDQLGILLLNVPVLVPPGQSFTFSTTEQIVNSVTNLGIWSAGDGYGHFAGDNDTATVNVLMPSIVLTKTVSDAPGICAPTKAVTVTAGSSVTYCYEIENTGQVEVTSHTLFDDDLGMLLEDEPQAVGPGEHFVFSTTVVANQSVINTATWTAAEPFGNEAEAMDSASVSVTNPSINLIKTVRGTSGVCPGANNMSVLPGSTVRYCYELQNTGQTTLTTQTLIDDHLGTLLNNANIVIPPGQSHSLSQLAVITRPVTNIATWTAKDTFNNELQTQDSAEVSITGVSLQLEKTVSATPGVCQSTTSIQVPPGTSVTYCFTIENTGQITLTRHTLVDARLGLLLNGAEIIVPPGETEVFSTTAVVNVSESNSASWTALDPYGNVAVDSASANVTVINPGINVDPVNMVSVQGEGEIVVQELTINNTGPASLNWSLSENQNPGKAPGANGGIGDPIISLNFGSQLNNNILVGVEYDGNNFWVTAGGISNNLGEPNLLYKLDSNAELVAVYTQTTTSPFGWRDLAWDGNFLYASDSDVIEQIDPADGMPTGVEIDSPLGLNRAIAYDPASDHFWVGSFGDDIHEIDRNGNSLMTITNVFNNIGNVTGLAWDDVSPGGPYLWAWTNDSPPKAVQIDPDTGNTTGVTFVGSSQVGGDGGGATISANLYPDKLAFIGLHEAGNFNDTVVVYDMGISTGVCGVNENGWISFAPGSGFVPAFGSTNVDVEFDSTGLDKGVYNGALCLTSNDPQSPLIVIEVQLVVDLPNQIFLPIINRGP